VIDRTNRSWQELFTMASLFLQDRHQTTTGGAGQGTAMLFEMNALFEEYVGRLIARALAGTGLTVSLQGGRLFCLAHKTANAACSRQGPTS
jgi:5-methylcytosine-specific restriction enzyme subunit McrC